MWADARTGNGSSHVGARGNTRAPPPLRAGSPRRGVGRCAAYGSGAQLRTRFVTLSYCDLDPAARAAGPEAIGQSNLGEARTQLPHTGWSVHRPGAHGTWHSTAALLIEVVSPNDESWEKLPFYADHDVDEVLIVDPAKRSIDWLALTDGEYRPVEHSGADRPRPTRARRADRLAVSRVNPTPARAPKAG